MNAERRHPSVAEHEDDVLKTFKIFKIFKIEISGLCHFLAVIHAQIILFSNFAKCVRARAEGQKTFFTLPSITREPLVVGSSTLRHFVAQSSLYSTVILHFMHCVSERAQEPAIN